jgi:hypothetical protein
MKDETGKTVDPSEIDDMQRLVSSGSPEDPLWKKGVAREKPCGRYTLIVGILATYLHFLGFAAAWLCHASPPDYRDHFEVMIPVFLLGGLVFGAWAWIIGVREMRRMKEGITPDDQRGRAIAGMVLGIIAAGIPLITLVAFLSLIAVSALISSIW